SSEATGTASVTVNTADQFFSRGNYLVIAKILPDEVNFIAESMHQEERRFTVTDGFNLQWLNNDIPVVNISQQFVIRGRSNAILTLYLTDSNGTSYELYPVTLDFEGYYKGNITFDAKGNYSLYVVPEYYEDSSYYNPIHKTIYGVQYLTWSIHPLSREELIPNQQNIDYLNITVNEVLDLLITGESPYELWLNGGLSLSYNYSRVFVYNFTRKGIYTIILKGTDPTCWSVNYTCIVSVYEPLIVEVSLPQSAVESQAIVAGLVVRSISEGPVPGVEIDFHVISNETGTGPAFTGTTDSYGKREFQIAYLSAGIYSVYLSLTPPEGSFYSFDNNATFWGYLFVWSSTTIEVNHFMTSYGKNVSVTAVIKSSSGTGISNVPVSFYYYNDSITDAVFIGTSITDSNGTSTITWIVNLDPGEYYLSVELDSTWPYDSSKQTTTFKVTGDPPTITNFRIVFVGQDSGSYYFLATVMIDASNAVSRVNLTLNSSVFHLTETNKGYWQVSFQVEPGNYSVVVSVVDKYGYSDSYKIDRYQLLPENTDEYIDSSTNNGSNSSTSSNNLENNLKTSYLEDSMTLVLIGMGFLVFFLKKREKMFV
ncbi:MAG: Ig-like domain-containing protein, partial [Candidatus Odinarchaeota archaeon]